MKFPPRAARGYTLLEVLMAMTILALALAIVMSTYVAALKRSLHTDRMLKGSTELRFASDQITETVRSAPQAPVVQNSGLRLLVTPRDLGSAVVEDVTWINVLHNVKGSKSNQKVMRFGVVTPGMVTVPVFASSSRPSGALTGADISSYFRSASSLPQRSLDSLFSVGDTISIPGTAYGPATTAVINNISNGSTNRTLTMEANLGVDVPSGTLIVATSGRRLLYSVETAGAARGELRFYPDHRDTTRFTVLARDIDPAPRTDPNNPSSPATTPFVLNSARSVVINLQQVPAGSMAGRTAQGIRTVAYARTDALAQ